MKNPLSIETYVTVSNPHEVMRILKELGAPAVTSNEDLLNKVHYATDKFGAKMFERLADIETPYRSLILTEYEKERGGEKKSNCSGGCSGCDGKYSNCSGCHSNANGDEGWNDEIENIPQTGVSKSTPAPAGNLHQHLMVAGVVLVGVIAIAMVVKK